MKKILAIVLSLLLGLTFAGCGGDDANDGRTKIRISFFKAGFGDAWLQATAAEYEKLHPDIDIIIEGDESMDDLVRARFQAGPQSRNYPDIVSVTNYAYYHEFVRNGYLENLDSLYETEVEKGGEVAIEQFHITRLIVPQFNIRAGHIIVPVGLTNAHHEPINFFGTYRPEGETTILPSTWHENGLEFFGSFGKGYASFDYQAMIVAGLNANGFDRNTWIASGKQGIFEEDNFTSPGYVARLDYKGVPGLRIGASFYYCADAGSNSDKADTYSSTGKIPVRIYTADAQYRNKYVIARANMVYGNLGNSAKLSEANTKLSNKSPYSRITPIAKNVVSYAAEAGLNISAFFKGNKKVPVIYPFARYEYYNPQEKGEASQIMEKRCQVSMWTAGLNWYALPNLVVKADYTTRQIGTNKVFGTGKYNSENEFSIGIAYIGWFVKK